MKVTLITPTLNAARYLPEMLASVRSQQWPDLEHLVIDGGSTDGTVEIVSDDPDLILVRQRSTGLYAALNEGVSLARGDVIAFVNGDDLLASGALSTLTAAFESHPGAMMSSGGSVVFRDEADGHSIERTVNDDGVKRLREQDVTHGFPMLNARIYRRSLLESVGPFDTRWPRCPDHELLLRVVDANPRRASVDDVVYHYRAHPRSLTFRGGIERDLIDEIVDMCTVRLAETRGQPRLHHRFRRWHTWGRTYLAMRDTRHRHIRDATREVWAGLKVDPFLPLVAPVQIAQHFRMPRPASLTQVRVAFVALTTSGAAGSYVSALGRAMSTRAEVGMWIPESPALATGVETHALDKPASRLGVAAHETTAWVRRSALAEALVGWSPDVVHIVFGEGYPTSARTGAALAARGITVAATWHDPRSHGQLADRIQHVVAARTMRSAAGVHVHCDALVPQVLAANTLVSEHPAFPCPACSGATTTQPLRTEGTIAFVGRFAPYKGVDALCDALGRYWRRGGERRFVAVGQGRVPRSLQHLQEQWPALTSVENAYISDAGLHEVLSRAAICVMPYLSGTQSALPWLRGRTALTLWLLTSAASVRSPDASEDGCCPRDPSPPWWTRSSSLRARGLTLPDSPCRRSTPSRTVCSSGIRRSALGDSAGVRDGDDRPADGARRHDKARLERHGRPQLTSTLDAKGELVCPSAQRETVELESHAIGARGPGPRRATRPTTPSPRARCGG